ncbi:hypothetical protein D3C80_1109720 [compost metagenome]
MAYAYIIPQLFLQSNPSFPYISDLICFSLTRCVIIDPKAKNRQGGNDMIKKHEIYKTDKWNMMTVEVQGRYIILREISDQWGEETHTFMSRPAMMEWVNNRFNKESYKDNEEEYKNIIAAFKQV